MNQTETGLNPMQMEAVEHTEGPLLILAGAGSGKTRVLTHRIASLIRDKGVNLWNIMAITFTNKAAGEMRERVDKIVGYGSERIWVSTFHSSCVRILRRDIDRIGFDKDFTIYDTDDSKRVIKDILKELDIDEKKLTPREVYAQNVNSTVGITTSITTNYWGYQTTSAASGSGFILTEDGYILTNYHVIQNSSSVQVTTYDNTSYSASIVGYDESNDIAVLKIDATGLTPVVLGSSDDLYVGDEVMAIGNPLGELTFSLTVGYVSALDREVTLSSGTTMDLIQTDAAINSGNSGGALFNSYGEVVGITNAKYSSSSSSGSASIDNIGFAIPINHVKNIITSIIEKGYIVKPYIGVSVTTVSSEMVSYGLPQGAAVKAVSENSPAAECGLKINDIITAINGEEITTSSELVKIVSASQPGDEMTLTVYRQGESEQLTLTLTVGEQQKSALANPTSSSNQQQSSGSYGGFPFGFGYGYGG